MSLRLRQGALRIVWPRSRGSLRWFHTTFL